MKLLAFCGVWLILTGSAQCSAQKAGKNVERSKNTTPFIPAANRSYSYYDPLKGGYVITEKNGDQSFLPATPAIPKMPANYPIDVPITRWLNLDLYPQLHYPYNNYPANPMGNNTPGVPVLKKQGLR